MRVISTPLNSELMPFFARAAKEAGQPDHGAVRHLCERLSGIRTIKYMEAAEQVGDLPMPAGYFHLRLFDEATGKEFASAWATEPGTAITPVMIALQVIVSEPFLKNEWIKTSPMFDHFHSAKGVLDLAITFKPRPIPLGEFDID